MAYILMATTTANSEAVFGTRGQNYTGQIGNRRQLAGGVRGCSGGTQRPCGDHLHQIQLKFHGKPLFSKIGQFFLRHVLMWWNCPMWPKRDLGDQKGPIWRDAI